jgi:hypothetical protein
MSQVHTHLSSYPFKNVDGNLFPPVCLKSHWDPTQMLRHILPTQHVSLPQDFRPLVKICKNYVTSAPMIPAPMPPTNMVFPTGGEHYPPGRYSANIDKESVLRTLDVQLDKWCSASKYIPEVDSNMYVAGSTVPDRIHGANSLIPELAMPQALLRMDGYNCRTKNDTLYFERSGRLFNNPTKQDRYGADKWYANPEATHGRGEPMPHGGVNIVSPTTQAFKAKGQFPQPGGTNLYKGYDKGNDKQTRSKRGDISFVGVATGGSAAPVW